MLAAIAVVLVAGAGVAVGVISSDGHIQVGASRPELSPALAGAPWLDQPDGSPLISAVEPRPSLQFPRGVRYDDALAQLFTSALETGDVPAGTKLTDPLPTGVVLAGDAEEGITVSLVAPWGYDVPSGAILPPSVGLSKDLTPAEVQDRIKAAQDAGRAVPEGATVDVPDLADCQVVAHVGDEAPACEGGIR